MEFIVTVRAKVETQTNSGKQYMLHLSFTPIGIDPTDNGEGQIASFRVTPETWQSVDTGDEIKLGVID